MKILNNNLLKNKRGINQYVATILLIALVVLIIVLIILWARRVTQERAEKAAAISDLESKCKSTDIRIEALSNGIKVINSGSVDFHGLYIKQKLDDGTELVDTLLFKFELGGSFDLVYGGACEGGENTGPGQLCSDLDEGTIIPGQQAQGYRDAPLLGCGEGKKIRP